jgi:hypothetical protein
MPPRTTRLAISIDSELVEPAKKRAKEFGRFGDPNMSAYISMLIRKDLGLWTEPPSPTGRFNPHEGKPVLSKYQMEQIKKKGGSFSEEDQEVERLGKKILRDAIKKVEGK